MSKKVVTMIAALFCCLIVVVSSLLGTLPDEEYRTPIESIEFIDPTKPDGVCEVGSNGRKIIKIEFGTKEYQLQYRINPSDATDQSVLFYINCDEDVATVNEAGLITFYKEISVTVRIFNTAMNRKIRLTTFFIINSPFRMDFR